jgi:(p)ppGpp synthase/HD superfamily hydrolase
VILITIRNLFDALKCGFFTTSGATGKNGRGWIDIVVVCYFRCSVAKKQKLSLRFEDAFRYAFELHARQTRKGGDVPYIAHLLGVTALVLEDGGDEDEAIAALLHDAVEDQGGKETREEIHRRFGERVARIVDGCTDADETPKPPWRDRKNRYIEHIRHATPEVRRVSLADKLHNARTILRDFRRCRDDVWDRFTGGKAGTLWYYETLLQTYQECEDSYLLEELKRVVSELQQLSS